MLGGRGDCDLRAGESFGERATGFVQRAVFLRQVHHLAHQKPEIEILPIDDGRDTTGGKTDREPSRVFHLPERLHNFRERLDEITLPGGEGRKITPI